MVDDQSREDLRERSERKGDESGKGCEKGKKLKTEICQ
jgi:hypothetical protein